MTGAGYLLQTYNESPVFVTVLVYQINNLYYPGKTNKIKAFYNRRRLTLTYQHYSYLFIICLASILNVA